jgi:hypothetical protein
MSRNVARRRADRDAGQVPDACLTHLAITTGAVHETPNHDPARQCFKTGYVTLRGSRDLRDLINVSPATNDHAFNGMALTATWGSTARLDIGAI